jgi:hypothetical protein
MSLGPLDFSLRHASFELKEFISHHFGFQENRKNLLKLSFIVLKRQYFFVTLRMAMNLELLDFSLRRAFFELKKFLLHRFGFLDNLKNLLKTALKKLQRQ